MTAWNVAHIGIGYDDLVLGDRQVWKEDWRPVNNYEQVTLPHPAYPHEMHSYGIYEIGDPAHVIRFAAAELSPGVYGFYLPVNSN